MNINNLKNIFLIGIGGIGMSALARYFNQKGLNVSGYDATSSQLTKALQQEGMDIIFEQDVEQIDKEADLVIYTPAIKGTNPILQWYHKNDFPLYKRSEVLEWITKKMKIIAVAGTHGKTTISSLIAHILRESGMGGYAFLGGIAANYKTNFWQVGTGNWAVIEADEFDKSLLRLSSEIAVLTAMEADHLDIYGSEKELLKTYVAYTENIKQGGSLWYKHGMKNSRQLKGANKFSYSLQNDMAEAYADNVSIDNGSYWFDWQYDDEIEHLKLNLGGMHNVENAVVAIAVAKQLGVSEADIRKAVESFKGVNRRFQYIVKTDKVVYIDDYAHHPTELKTLIRSAKQLFRDKKCTVVFQPHLYSRTRDLVKDFAGSFYAADQVILLDIYPAREEPIPGISAEWLKEQMELPVCTVLSKEGLLEYVKSAPLELFITAGAGDIDRLVAPIKEIILERL